MKTEKGARGDAAVKSGRKKIMGVLTIDIEQSDVAKKVTVMRVAGDLGEHSVHRVMESFDSVIEGKHFFVVMELSGVSAISSVVVGVLMESRKRLVEREGNLVLAGMSLEIKSQLTLMGAHKIFNFYYDLRAALAAYNWQYEVKPEQMELSFPPHMELVPAVRQLLRRVAKQKGYGNRDAFRIETIVDEVCNNAAEHSNKDASRDIRLSVSIDLKKIEIKVVNNSDPEKVEALREFSKTISETFTPVISDKRGRGLSLIKMLSTDLAIDITDGGTSVHVTKIRED
jgi:anti-anti-sigma factor